MPLETVGAGLEVIVKLADLAGIDVARCADAAGAARLQRGQEQGLGARKIASPGKRSISIRVLFQSPELSFTPARISG